MRAVQSHELGRRDGARQTQKCALVPAARAQTHPSRERPAHFVAQHDAEQHVSARGVDRFRRRKNSRDQVAWMLRTGDIRVVEVEVSEHDRVRKRRDVGCGEVAVAEDARAWLTADASRVCARDATRRTIEATQHAPHRVEQMLLGGAEAGRREILNPQLVSVRDNAFRRMIHSRI